MSGSFVILFISAYILQQQTGIAYTLVKSDPIADVFPKSNMLVMVYENQDEGAINKLVDELEEDVNVKSIMGYSTILGKPYTSSELADTLNSMGENISLNSSVIDMLYYDYYSEGELGTMTAGQFLTFISDTVLNDETFSEYLDDDMKENIEILNRFADADTLTSPMNSRQLADFFDMDEANMKDLFLLYYIQNGGVPTGSMTLPVFLDFVTNDVAQDSVYSSMFDHSAYASELAEETSESLSSARIMINAVISGKSYTVSEMSNLFRTLSDDMEPSMIELLYLYAESIQNKNPSQTMTLETLLNYLSNDVLNDSRFESVIDPDMRQTLLAGNLCLLHCLLLQPFS